MGSHAVDLKDKLVEAAIKAKEHAYCPYSNFRVGAAVLTDDDQIFTGCNVENASYGLTICAERTALTKAVSEGKRKFKHIAVTSDCKGVYLPPCGACRQFIAEFGLEWNVILVKYETNELKEFKVDQLLPFSFESNQLNTTK